MARLPALIETIGNHHPRGAVGVDHYARILRKAGKIAPSKRGVGASHVTVSEASNLLFGLAEMNKAHLAPDAVDMLRAAVLMGPLPGEDDPISFLRDTSAPFDFSTLGNLLDSILVELATVGSRIAGWWDISLRIENPSILGSAVEVMFRFTGPTYKSIKLSYVAHHPDFPHVPMIAEDMAERFRKAESHDSAPTGITFEIVISFAVLLAVAHCLASLPSLKNPEGDA